MPAAALIIITGHSAAGKSTLAKWLGKQLGIPVISKDSIKEVLFDEIGWNDREWSKMIGGASVEVLYYVAQAQLEAGHSVILENVFHPEFASATLSNIARQTNASVLQIICTAQSDVLFERFKQRALSGERHKGHGDAEWLSGVQEKLSQNHSVELAIDGELLHIDTTDFLTVSYDKILEQVKEKCLL